MEIKEFGEVIAREVESVLGKEYTASFRDVVKNNGVIYHALVIRRSDDNVAPTIYIDNYFAEYKMGTKLMGIVNEVVDIYRNCRPLKRVDMDFFFDFANVSPRLFFKVVNYRKNKEKLQDVPIKRALDLALVPMCLYKDDVIGNGTITINKSHLQHWEVTEEELWENVIASASTVSPAKITGIEKFFSGITGAEIEESINGINVLTNTSGNLGAAVIFYPDLLKEMADEYDSDLYIIPSSIHECIIIPDTCSAPKTEYMRDMIKEVNRTTLADIEILSDNLYRYDREEDKFHIVKN